MRPGRWLLLSLMMVQFAALASSSAAQQKLTTEIIPRSVLFGNPERTDPQISPDGTQPVSYTHLDGLAHRQATSGMTLYTAAAADCGPSPPLARRLVDRG